MGKGGASAGTGSTFLGAVSASCFAYRFAVRFLLEMKKEKQLLELIQAIKPGDPIAANASRKRWNSIAKPLGSLGLLEEAVVKTAALTGSEELSFRKKELLVFCADNGVVLNSGTIINNDGSTFRNYGTIIEETPDAVSPDLAPGSKPIVHYGEDPETVLTGIPEGAVGGACGDTLFWYLEELEEEEAEKLRHFTEGHIASASDAERAEDDASASYILHITGSGAMDNFDLDGGNSTAPWFEELDGAVRAVKIDEGVTQIGKNAFYGIRTLAYVSFAGTDTEWKSVKVQSGNEALDKTVLLFGGDDDLVLGDPLVADDEEVSWTEPEAKPAAAAGKATASDAEKEEPEEGKKEQGDTEQKPETPETPWTAEPESRKPEETESGKSGNGKQDSEA